MYVTISKWTENNEKIGKLNCKLELFSSYNLSNGTINNNEETKTEAH